MSEDRIERACARLADEVDALRMEMRNYFATVHRNSRQLLLATCAMAIGMLSFLGYMGFTVLDNMDRAVEKTDRMVEEIRQIGIDIDRRTQERLRSASGMM